MFSALHQGMGGQHGYFGLWLDSDFGRGHSRARPKCTTYGSPQLSGEEDFSLDSVEVWAVGKPPEPEEVRGLVQFILYIHLMLDSVVMEQKCYKGVWLHRNMGNLIMSSKISIVTIPQRAFLNLFFILPMSTVALHSSTSENWAGSTTSHPQRCIISRITAKSPTMHHKWRTSFTSLLFFFFTFYSCFL